MCTLSMRVSAAHPRSRGENGFNGDVGFTPLGSSPLTRGKPALSPQARLDRRLIPAHAGKTRRRSRLPPPLGAHPRSRGENTGSVRASIECRGSSPLTRGKLRHAVYQLPRVGLIPAHAGKTRGRAGRVRARRAHPRSRGENGLLALIPTVAGGSSPLTRGKLALSATHCPASLAHPRSRGENSHLLLLLRFRLGSSPLTRGKPCPSAQSHALRGLIPAHAGKTTPGLSSPSAATAHPRSRGENPPLSTSSPRSLGSSPLTRGKRRGSPRGRHPLGLIPAHAGKTTHRRA